MEFEYDQAKSASNLKKHGIDFISAQRMWLGNVVEVQAPRPPEMRYLCIGIIDGEYWSAIVKYVGMQRRIISVRKSTEKEITYAKAHAAKAAN